MSSKSEPSGWSGVSFRLSLPVSLCCLLQIKNVPIGSLCCLSANQIINLDSSFSPLSSISAWVHSFCLSHTRAHTHTGCYSTVMGGASKCLSHLSAGLSLIPAVQVVSMETGGNWTPGLWWWVLKPHYSPLNTEIMKKMFYFGKSFEPFIYLVIIIIK